MSCTDCFIRKESSATPHYLFDQCAICRAVYALGADNFEGVTAQDIAHCIIVSFSYILLVELNYQAQVQSQIQVPNPKYKVQRKGNGTGADNIILQATLHHSKLILSQFEGLTLSTPSLVVNIISFITKLNIYFSQS